MTPRAFVDTNVVLLTEDLQDGQELGGLVVRNPFTTPVGSEL